MYVDQGIDGEINALEHWTKKKFDSNLFLIVIVRRVKLNVLTGHTIWSACETRK
jgi:hypothetical protein